MRSSRRRVRRSSAISWRVGQAARGALGQRLEERQLLVDRWARRRQPEPEAAEQPVSDQQRQVDPVPELHGGEPLGLGVVVRERPQRVVVEHGDDARAALAQLRDREVDLLAGRLAGGEEGGGLGPGRALVVRGEPARRAGLVDEVERAGVGDPRHQQRHERVDPLVGPARPVGEPLDLEQQLEALVALVDPRRRAGHPRRREGEAHLGPVTARPLADVAAGGHRGHHRQPEAEPRALGVRRHPAPVVDHSHVDHALAGLGGQRHAAAPRGRRTRG